ncbi:flagellar assembly protein FliH [Sulfuricurvum sp.]|uniref:flagellar assembly protein FliH n=1 Tax=Sulfuricurvum sp. TaxID=2025608 RepID=UPI003BB69906
MDVVIQQNRSGSHNISKYQFKILSSLSGTSIKEATQEINHEMMVDHHDNSNSSKDALIESLLNKADEMSSNVIKMQMRLESMQEEHAHSLEEAKKVGYEEGLIAGILQEQAKTSGQSAQSHEQLSQSVKTLENAAVDFVIALESIQKELTHTALDIAKEVIGIETTEHSSKIAAKLSNDLIEELKDASKITLRVNPADHGFISEKVGSLTHVEVLSDRAISLGGVVAISDAGNIDSEIKKRYERLKRSLLLES